MEATLLQSLLTLLAFGPSPGQPGQQPWWAPMFPLVLLVFLMYFMLIRPQQRKAKEHDRLMKALKAGDKIVTSGGIVGSIVAVKEKTLSIRSADTKLEILKSSVAEVTERAESSGQGNP